MKQWMVNDHDEGLPRHLHGYQLDDSDSSDDEDDNEMPAPTTGRRSQPAPSRSTTRCKAPAVPRVAEWQEDDEVMPPLRDRDDYDSDSSDDEDETSSAIKVGLGGSAAPYLL